MGNITLEDRTVNDTVSQLFSSSLVWDNHGCTSLDVSDQVYILQLERYRNAGVDVVFLNVGFDAMPWEAAILLLAHLRQWIRRHADNYMQVETVADINRARQERKLGVAFDLEGGNALNGQLSMVNLYYDLGVRWMLFAYNRNTLLGGGCQDEDHGLTEFGREVLEEMHRVGMVVCCSHVGHRTAMDIMSASRAPVIFSHSNPAALCEHPRNIRDEAITACARTGGVVGINGIGIFLGDNDDRAETVVRHIDYVADLVGVEHVGIGLDYVCDQEDLQRFVRQNPDLYPPEKYPAGIKMVNPEQIPEIAEGLLKIGYSESDLRCILGENFLRVAQRVWK